LAEKAYDEMCVDPAVLGGGFHMTRMTELHPRIRRGRNTIRSRKIKRTIEGLRILYTPTSFRTLLETVYVRAEHCKKISYLDDSARPDVFQP